MLITMDVNYGDNTLSVYHKKYKVLRQIANGAFGSVHCVQRKDTKVIHAAKYVKSKTDDLEREVKALRELSARSSIILKFISLYHNPNGVQAVLVTEFLAGGDLCERTSSKDYRLTEQKCRVIIRQICRGVDYIHRSNYIHLDLKPFNVVFSQKKDDYDLRIIDFGLAREIDETREVRVGMCGTVEYMSPEVMDQTMATPASDNWGIGVIAYQLLSGGVSPFFAVNRFRTMAKVLDCEYSLEQDELSKTTDEAKDFISRLLVKEPRKRMTAEQCLQHSWLVDDKLYLGILETLETTWMRRCLARRRWYRLLNAVRVMRSIRQMSGTWDSTSNTGSTSDDDDVIVDTSPASSAKPRPNGVASMSSISSGRELPIFDISHYSETFEKLHLIMNNGAFGTMFCVQHTVSGDVFTAKHVRTDLESVRREAAILHKVRNEPAIIAFYGLYEAPNTSVIVTDFLVGGDLVERTANPDFVLNESKCKSYIRQICQGLSHIHACKILHLDLKPFRYRMYKLVNFFDL
jgi:serine/threonine protein kinase